jgi:hypothetical protein
MITYKACAFVICKHFAPIFRANFLEDKALGEY